MKIDTSEVMRYMGAGKDEGILKAVEKEAALMEEDLAPKYIYRIFDLKKEENFIEIIGTDIKLTGRDGAKLLESSEKCALLICTLGFKFENELRRLSASDMARALIYDACGSAYVEAGCNEAEEKIKEHFPDMWLTDRFSPGYGDTPLELSENILSVLNGEKVLGVHLTETFLFNPTKTVSAILGISGRPQEARIRGCDYCDFKDRCKLRREGGACGK